VLNYTRNKALISGVTNFSIFLNLSRRVYLNFELAYKKNHDAPGNRTLNLLIKRH